MNPTLNDFYAQLAGIGTILAVASALGTSAWARGLTGLGIGLVALSDAYTWSQNGVVVPPPLHPLSFMDFVGVLSALVALMFTTVKELSRFWPAGSVIGALTYIGTCFLYWLILPCYPDIYHGILTAAKLGPGSRPLFLVLFALCEGILAAVLLVRIGRIRGGSRTGARLFAGSVWLYLIGYYILVTVPILKTKPTAIVNNPTRVREVTSQTPVSQAAARIGP